MSSREERIGLNEAVFREVNERIEALAQTFELKDDPLDLVCECGDAACVQRITMPRDEYEQLRSNPHHFAVYSGHEIPEVEEVISQMKGYDIVSKDEGVPERVAEETDPRS
ncbi:MAG: hypothetical protein QOH23_2561 [Gaiellaceae bacterium]|jgi:hypothetical protein|nr:hypothetical protein [Gaiellaceae bacterium]